MFRAVSILVFLAVAGALVVRIAFSSRNVRDIAPGGRRFSLWEALIHLVAAGAFVVLAVTGYVPVLFQDKPVLGLWGLAHVGAAPVFALSMALLTLTWAEHCRYGRHDLPWTAAPSPTLGGAPRVDRYTGRQKTFMWVSALLAAVIIITGVGRMVPVFASAGQDLLLQIHRSASLVFVVRVMLHLAPPAKHQRGGGAGDSSDTRARGLSHSGTQAGGQLEE
jgi:hypothetical protein